MITLIRTLEGVNSQIFNWHEGRRIKLCDCSLNIELYEDKTKINAIGGAGIKSYKIGITICNGCPEVDPEKITKLEITTDIQTQSGIFKRFYLMDFKNIEINVGGDWTLELNDHKQIKELFKL